MALLGDVPSTFIADKSGRIPSINQSNIPHQAESLQNAFPQNFYAQP